MSWWTLETLTIEPGFSSARKCRIASRAHRNEPRRLTASDVVEVRARQLLGGPRDLDAGVVDEHVDAAERLGRLADHAHDLVLLGDVAADEHVAHALLLTLATQACTCSSVSAPRRAGAGS